jgi:hypothetical protein
MIIEIDKIVVMTLRIREFVRQEAGDRSDLIYRIGSEAFHQRCHIQKMKGSKEHGHLGNYTHLIWFFGRENCSLDLAGPLIACPLHPGLSVRGSSCWGRVVLYWNTGK